MTYSSARFADGADSLEHAQLCKIRKLLDRLNLKPGQRLLEIGCGWGTLAIEAAKRGANVVGLTLSTEQKAWAERKIAEKRPAGRIEIRLQDYRETAEQFDAVASVEMVGSGRSALVGRLSRQHRAQPQPGGRAALQFISMRSRAVRPIRAQRRLHPDLHFPGRLPPRRTPVRSHCERARSVMGRTERLPSRLCRDVKRWRERYDEAVARGALQGLRNRSTISGAIISCTARVDLGAG